MTKPLRIHTLLHVPFEGLGCIEHWIKDRQHILSVTHFYKGDKLPSADDFDWLIVMGGPMGVYDEKACPWLFREKHFIREVIHSGKTVIGICLGSQLIAHALDSKVYKNKETEIGWYPVQLTKPGHPVFSSLPSSFWVFHWHGDTFDLPDGAIRLAESEACKNQAFIYENRVLGIQFHFEVTESSVREMADHGRNELQPDRYVQSYEELISKPSLIHETNNYMYSILDFMEEPLLS